VHPFDERITAGVDPEQRVGHHGRER
jgi:hypothetical protein